MADPCDENPCPNAIATQYFFLGWVKLVRVAKPDVAPALAPSIDVPFGPVAVEGKMPPGVERPQSGEFYDYSHSSVGIYRRVEYLFDRCETRCSGPFRYQVCHYEQTAEIVCHGHPLQETNGPRPPRPRRLGGTKETWSVVGLCWEEIFHWIGSLPFGAIQQLLASHESRGPGPRAGPELASALAGMTPDHMAGSAEPILVHRRISRPAYAAIGSLMRSGSGEEIEPPALASLESGWGDLEALADELRASEGSGAAQLVPVFDHLSSATIAVPSEATTDDVWLNEAGSFIARRRAAAAG